MPIPSYTPGYPPDGSSLGQTKVPIRNNLDGTFQTLNVDHVNNNGQPGSNPAGYHTIIHEVTQTSVNTVSGVNQVFSGVPGTLSVNSSITPAIPSNGDTQLYSLSGTGVLSQLTGASASANGYAWMGGMLVQWGVVNSPSGSGSVSFPVTFPTNAPFSIQITIAAVSASGINAVLNSGSVPSTTSFSYLATGGVAKFYWVAIGN